MIPERELIGLPVSPEMFYEPTRDFHHPHFFVASDFLLVCCAKENGPEERGHEEGGAEKRQEVS